MRNLSRTGPGRLITTACATLALTGASLSVAAFSGASTAAAAPLHHATATARSAVVVKERVRPHFGKILVTVHGGALYYLPRGSCNSMCLAAWPRLVMPRGKTIPKGANCLGTARFGNHRLQVTYRRHRLYTFIGDSGTSVNGNGQMGFKVAKVLRRC